MSARAFIFVVVLGICVRGIFFVVSPPNNSYDNHLEAVSIHRSDTGNFTRASPDACWQCYQPPLYYVIANAIVNHAPRDTQEVNVWKRVQGISFVASSLSLILCALSLWILSRERISASVALFLTLVAALLPRLAYTSAMPTNDALLEMTVSLAVFGYVFGASSSKGAQYGYLLVFAGTLLAALVKQSGLVLAVPLAILLGARLIFNHNPLRLSIVSTRFGILVVVACFADEIWRFSHTGLVLASNQDFFAYAANQPPGRLGDVSFFTLDLAGLVKAPFLSDHTLSSFWTQIYGRLWFDYERRFYASGNISLVVGSIIYILALPLTLFLAASAVKFRAILARPFLPAILALICLGFFAVPILQTIRFPYYSSMKAVFLTAGITPILCWVSFGASCIATKLSKYRLLFVLTAFLLTICLLSLFLLLTTSSQAWSSGVSGPMWPLPPIRR